jgi:hypothetical protein
VKIDKTQFNYLLNQIDKSTLIQQNFDNYIQDTNPEDIVSENYTSELCEDKENNPDELVEEEEIEYFDPRDTQRMKPNLLQT